MNIKYPALIWVNKYGTLRVVLSESLHGVLLAALETYAGTDAMGVTKWDALPPPKGIGASTWNEFLKDMSIMMLESEVGDA